MVIYGEISAPPLNNSFWIFCLWTQSVIYVFCWPICWNKHLYDYGKNIVFNMFYTFYHFSRQRYCRKIREKLYEFIEKNLFLSSSGPGPGQVMVRWGSGEGPVRVRWGSGRSESGKVQLRELKTQRFGPEQYPIFGFHQGRDQVGLQGGHQGVLQWV